MHRCQALLLHARVDQFYPDIIGCLPMASLRLTSGISAHSAGRSKLRLQRLSVCAKELHNVRFWHIADITTVLNDVRFWG